MSLCGENAQPSEQKPCVTLDEQGKSAGAAMGPMSGARLFGIECAFVEDCVEPLNAVTELGDPF